MSTQPPSAPGPSSTLRQEQVLIIEPGRTENNYWTDLWRYRELFLVLAWRDISVRYKQTIIGVAWAVLRPFLTMVIFTVIFGRVADLPSDGNAPYALLSLLACCHGICFLPCSAKPPTKVDPIIMTARGLN